MADARGRSRLITPTNRHHQVSCTTRCRGGKPPLPSRPQPLGGDPSQQQQWSPGGLQLPAERGAIPQSVFYRILQWGCTQLVGLRDQPTQHHHAWPTIQLVGHGPIGWSPPGWLVTIQLVGHQQGWLVTTNQTNLPWQSPTLLPTNLLDPPPDSGRCSSIHSYYDHNTATYTNQQHHKTQERGPTLTCNALQGLQQRVYYVFIVQVRHPGAVRGTACEVGMVC